MSDQHGGLEASAQADSYQPQDTGFEPGLTAARRRRRWPFVALAGLLLVLMGGGAVFAYQLLSGGGTQPERFVPADAIAFFKVDGDPAAAQKLAAMQFLRKFPDLKDKLGDEDLREAIVEELLTSQDIEDVTFDKDVAPWLGHRAALAVLPRSSEEPEGVLLLQVTDEEAARSGLQKILDRVDGDRSLVVQDGYAFIGEGADTAKRVAATLEEASLEKSTAFAADTAAAGEPGVALGWANLTRMGDQLKEDDEFWADVPKEAEQVVRKEFDRQFAGRLVMTARFADDVVEIEGKRLEGKVIDEGAPVAAMLLRGMPEASAAAFAMPVSPFFGELFGAAVDAGLAEAGSGAERRKVLGYFKDRYGLELPEDLKSLVGRGIAGSLDATSFYADEPFGGLRALTDQGKATRVMNALERTTKDFGQPFPLVWSGVSDGLIVASDERWLQSMKAGGLGKEPLLAEALPDLADASLAVWLDLDRLLPGIRYVAKDPKDVDPFIPLRAAGMTVSPDGSFRVRVIAN